MAISIPEQLHIAGYRLVRELGSGAFGRVLLVRHEITGQQHALKLLHDKNPEHFERLQREAVILSRNIDNRYVVTILDASLNEEEPWLLLEYCEGGSLRSWVGRNHPWRDIVKALAHVVQGLQGIHSAGGFHRDLKPDNLLLKRCADGRFSVQVADFGLARMPRPGGSQLTQTPGGTLGYIAPEVLHGERFTSAADVYSLGIVTLELLTGSRNPEAVRQVQDPELRRTIGIMMLPDPTRRPDCRVLAGEFAKLLQRPETPVKVAAKEGEIDWGTVLAGAALVTAGILAVEGIAEWAKKVKR